LPLQQPVRALGQVLVQELLRVQGQGQEPVLEQVLEPVRALGPVPEERSHRHSLQLQLQESSWHRASKGRTRSSKLRHLHCANCEFLGRLQLRRTLLQPPRRQSCLV
jgi:hypothetical protein